MPIEYSKDAELDIKPINGKRSKKVVQSSNTTGFTKHANP